MLGLIVNENSELSFILTALKEVKIFTVLYFRRALLQKNIKKYIYAPIFYVNFEEFINDYLVLIDFKTEYVLNLE